MSESKVKTLFDHLHQVTAVQDPNYWEGLSNSDKRTWSNYMIIRFLSMNTSWTELMSQLQPVIQSLDSEYLYKFLITILPKGKVYSKYVKGKDDDKYPKWLVELISKDYLCSTSTAIDYLHILYSTTEGRETIVYICQKYGTDEKTIKSLKLNK